MAKVEHVFLLMLENRSFDHMLGFSELTGPDAETGRETCIRGLTGLEANSFGDQAYAVTPDAESTMPDDPGHEFPHVLEQLTGVTDYTAPYPAIHNAGFVAAYVRSGKRSEPGEVMRCFNTPRDLPVLYALAREFAVCDAWHSSIPGPTVPNRLFAHAASSSGLDHSPSGDAIAWHEMIDGYSFASGTVFEALRRAGRSYGLYAGDSLPLVATLKGIDTAQIRALTDLGVDLAQDVFPYDYAFIEPSYNVFDDYRGSTCQHPCADVYGGESLIRELYLALRASPVWEKSLFIIVWDEHGGFYDHVAPPAAVAPGDVDPLTSPLNQYGFTFEQLGVRVPAIVISPFIPRGTIDHRVYDHASIPATLEAVFEFPPLTNRDAHARNVLSLLSLSEPRAALTQLPMSRSARASATFMANAAKRETPPARPDGPISGVVVSIVQAAMRKDLQQNPSERERIVARVSAIKTRNDAMAYVRDVESGAAAARDKGEHR